ncbi:hypothetical protein F4813DRAFT_103763 [Daldinia decipiens]|uniref:uncharacterized protein n=1 Tax=Daldinia decipiens TaxID=326647 RepID=UPI0020C1BBB5|nr:uncharacterized protein F4813DRAFT_103763 [Daldinia decipiens]KAI1662276.1 hypothetical protein F4813DRAFT_103763 [Daldinia decipiens]
MDPQISKKRSYSNSHSIGFTHTKKYKLPFSKSSSQELAQGNPEDVPLTVPTPSLIQEPANEEFISRGKSKISAWLEIDDPASPAEAKIYSTDDDDSDSDSILGGDASSEFIMHTNFRSTVLPVNRIELLHPNHVLPHWVQSHLDEIDAIPRDDIPEDICKIHARYMDTAMNEIYEAPNFQGILLALDLNREGWVEVEPKIPEDDEVPKDYQTLDEGLRSPTYTKLLKYSSGALFQTMICPPLEGGNTLPIPVPDILFGYNLLSVPELRMEMNNSDIHTLVQPNQSNVCFPYLVLEAKGHQDYFIKAENQAIISGRISLDETWPIFGDQDMVFLVNTMPYLAHIYVMWRSVSPVTKMPYYNVRLVAAFALLDLEQFKRFRSAIFHIQYWAETNRLVRIRTGFAEWKDKGYPPHKHQLEGRYREWIAPSSMDLCEGDQMVTC